MFKVIDLIAIILLQLLLAVYTYDYYRHSTTPNLFYLFFGNVSNPANACSDLAENIYGTFLA